MKNRAQMVVLAAIVVWCQITPVLFGQNAAPAASSTTAPVQLSAEVWDVLRMAHGNVSDATLTAYIKNSGKVYSLGASEILYLRDQGVSDQVLTAMLDQRKNVATTTAQAAQPTVWANNSSPQYAPAATQPAPTQPAPAYVQAAPVYTQPAPVYVYPSSYYYPSWPYYGGYWGYPGISFSFGYWGGHYGGYYGHGYYGGGHYGGGGYHGGGGHSGGGHSGGGGHH